MVKLFPQQKKAVDFVESCILDGKLCSITGGAGTGKTKTITARGGDGLIERLVSRGWSVSLIAMTNKAVTNASLMLANEGLSLEVEAKTIHSLLKKNKEVIDQKTGKRVFKSADKNPNDTEYNPEQHLLIIEEMGQVPNNPENEMVLELLSLPNPILCLGDDCQLPPIGEDIGSLFELCSDHNFNLTEVIRYKGDILDAALELRQNIKRTDALDGIENSNNGEEGIFKLIKKQLKNKANEFFTGEFKEDPNCFRILTWRKYIMDFWNQWAREQIYGKEALFYSFLPGERIICMESATEKEFVRTTHKSFWKTNKLMSASEEGTVLEVNEGLSDCAYAHGLKQHELVIQSEFGKIVNMRVIHDEHKPVLKSVLENYYRERKWKEYWQVRDYFHDIRPAYALNIDRIQGITLANVMLDMDDIASNRNTWHRNRIAYTCLTRAQKSVYF